MTTTATPVRFTQRPDHSLVLGLSATRAITLAASVLTVAVVTVTSGMTAGLITAIGLSPAAGSALLTVEGRALIEWTPDAARYVWRGAQGRLGILAKPGRPIAVGVLPIPGTGQRLSVLKAVDGAAILRDKTDDTWTAIAAVAGNGFLYADPETQDAACTGFGRALAAIGGSGQITRIHITHRTRPDTTSATEGFTPTLTDGPDPNCGDARPQIGSASGPARLNHATATARARRMDASPAEASTPAAAIYRQTLAENASGWRHETLVAVTLGGKAGRAAIHRAGGGTTAAARVLAAHRESLADTLAAADATVETWLTPADLTGWILDGYDPASTPITRQLRQIQSMGMPSAESFGDEPTIAGWSRHPRSSASRATRRVSVDDLPDGAATAGLLAGPVAVAESWSTVRTDSAWHQVLWVSNWPRFDMHPAFLAPLLLPAGATVTVSLVYEPIATPVALRQIGRDKVAQASDAALRRRLGTLDTAEQAARAADTAQREADIAAGHLDMRHTALVAVTAATRDELADAATRIRQTAAAAGCDTRILYGQQLAALNATILPTGCQL